MNNVSLQLQQYRALIAQESAKQGAKPVARAKDVAIEGVLERHPEKTDYFRNLMQRWQHDYLSNPLLMARAETRSRSMADAV